MSQHLQHIIYLLLYTSLQVVKLDLKYNQLSTIPKSLFSLPVLEELILSNNSLKKLTDVARLPENLAVLDVSHNKLTTLPDHVQAPNLRHLNISSNSFSKVPPCISSFVTLTDLNLSNNPSILELPVQMGRLSMLQRLDLSNLDDIHNPPREMRRNARDCIDYLYNKLHNAKGFYHMKILVVGSTKGGKTTMVQTLVPRGKEKSKPYSESGLEISQWSYRPVLTYRAIFIFDIWDFGGPEASTVQCCFYCQDALYLLLFDITKGRAAIKELKCMLDKIVQRAPSSMVIFVGTHLDMVTTQQRANTDALVSQVRSLAQSYTHQLYIVNEVILVALKNGTKNISQLKNTIYHNAAKYKTQSGRDVMGLKIPATYHEVDKQLRLQQQVMHRGIPVPIMQLEDLMTTIKQMKFDMVMQDDPELQALTSFLTNRGSLLSYNNMTCNLHKLIFTDSLWLYDKAKKIITTGNKSPPSSNGILHLKNLPHLFNDITQLKHIDQLLILFDDFEVALLMDNQCLLVPSLIPQDRPQKILQPFQDGNHFYHRYITFHPRNKAYSMSWNRLLSMIIYSIPRLQSAFAKIASSSTPQRMFEASISITHPGKSNQGRHDLTASSIRSLDMSSHSLDMAPSSFRNVARGVVDMAQRIRPWSFHSTNDNLPPLSPVQNKVVPARIETNTIQQFLNNSQFMSDLPHTPSAERASNSFDTDNSELMYWKTGLYFKDSSVTFQIETLADFPNLQKVDCDKLLIMASSNSTGRHIISQLVDLVYACIDQWCLGPAGSHDNTKSLEQSVPCSKCIKAKKAQPYEFRFDDCLSLVTHNKSAVTCGQDKDKNHSIDLADVFPELLFQDMQSDIILTPNDLRYEEMDSSPVSRGGYKLGIYLNKAVFLKTYSLTKKKAFKLLHHEAVILQRVQHPCVAHLIGATLYPNMTLVMESSPLGFLDQTLLGTRTPIQRLVIFRIAAEVAAALCYIHSQGIVYQNLSAATVMLWSLDPKSLCHCKLCNFENALHMSFIGVRGTQGPVGFTAPEVLHLRQSKQRSVYNHKADVFSFGMFLYQLVARENPFSNIPTSRVDEFVKMGKRPGLNDVILARTGYHYLCMLIKKCWNQQPNKRPKIGNLIKVLCTASVQSVMNVSPVDGRLPVCNATAVTSADINKMGAPSVPHNEIWVCCNDNQQAEISVYNTHTMTLMHKVDINIMEVQCMALCSEHMWVSIGTPGRPSVLHVYTTACCELVSTIDLFDAAITCMATGGDGIFLGTSKGDCYSINNTEFGRRHKNAKLPHIHISEHAIDGIAWSNGLIWASHLHSITLFNSQTLEPLTCIGYGEDQNWLVGYLSAPATGELVWSAHLREGSYLSAWHAHSHTHVLNIDTTAALFSITGNIGNNQNITAISPVLDTVWVGTSTGHILIYQQAQLLTWYHPYAAAVRFLTVINSRGPCGTERCMVVSGGNEYLQSLPNELQADDVNELQDGLDFLVMWEAHDARTIQQIKMVQESAPRHLDNYGSIRQILFNGEFEDGTRISTAKKIPEE